MFHAREGLFFERLVDGMVRVVKTSDAKLISDGNVVCDVVLTKEAFASVIASMSMSGETSESWQKALDLLNR